MISHELKTIFVHLPRTGGTSVETALVGTNWWKIDPQTKHLDWRAAKEVYADHWNDYLKFTIVRDPWDWLASLYHSHGRAGDKSWTEFVREPQLASHEPDMATQSELVGYEMDMMLRFETLQEGFHELCQRLGVRRELPHLQLGEAPYQHYSEVYDETLSNLVAEHFAEDVRRFGYRYISGDVAETRQLKQRVSRLQQQVIDLERELAAARRPSLRSRWRLWLGRQP